MRSLSSFLCLLTLLRTHVTTVHGLVVDEESLEAYSSRLQGIFQTALDDQSDTSALWIGIADPDYGDIYFALGNATGGPPADTPATLEQHFDIGSISKSVGGTAILRLAEQGVLALEDTVQDLIPDFAMTFFQYASYTVEDLLRMKTIVPDFINNANVTLMADYAQNISKRFSEVEIVDYAMEDYPNEGGIYSSTNFIVLELIAQAVDPEWALVLLASRLISTLSSLLIFLDSLHATRNRIACSQNSETALSKHQQTV